MSYSRFSRFTTRISNIAQHAFFLTTFDFEIFTFLEIYSPKNDSGLSLFIFSNLVNPKSRIMCLEDHRNSTNSRKSHILFLRNMKLLIYYCAVYPNICGDPNHFFPVSVLFFQCSCRFATSMAQQCVLPLCSRGKMRSFPSRCRR